MNRTPDEERRRRGIVRTAVVLAVLAIGFYVGFILVTGAAN